MRAPLAPPGQAGRAARVAAAAAATLLTLTACSAPQLQRTAATRTDGGTIVYAHQQEPACVFGGWIEQAYLSTQVLDSLTSLDEDGKAVPWLAISWDESEDGLTWTFHLKPGVKFTDGTAVDAAAVATNFDYWLGQGGNSTASAWLGGYYKKATAQDATTVRITLAKPYPRLAETVAQGYFGIQSAHALKTRTADENCRAPIGSGSFVVDHWNRGEDILLTRNEHYTSWPANARHQGPALVAAVDWQFVPDATTRASALKAGEVDAIYDVPSVDWEDLKDAGFQELKYVTGGRPQQLAFNTQQGPFTDERVRAAFASSINREPLVDAVGRGVIPAEGNGSVSQATPGYSEKAAKRWPYDAAKANRLLDQAGWTGRDAEGYRTKDGKRLTVTLPYGAGSIINAEGASILQGVAEQARQVGFDVTLVPVPPSSFFGGAYTKPSERDIYAGYWTSVTAGILWVNWRPGTEENPNGDNAAFSTDRKLAAIISRANSTRDIETQNQLYRQAQEYIADHALSVGIYDRLSTLAVSPHLADVWQENSQGGPVFHDAHFVD